jgi:hypothetical protein
MTTKDEPLSLITRKMTAKMVDPKAMVEDITNMMAKEQLRFYNAGMFAARNYGLKFFTPVVEQDRLDMMSLLGKRGDQLVELAKAMHEPQGIYAGPGTVQYGEKPVRKKSEG